MADNSMTFRNTLMQPGGKDLLCELTEFMLNHIWKPMSLSISTQSLMSAVMSVRPTATAFVIASTTPGSARWSCVSRSCVKARTSRHSLRLAGCQRGR